MYYWNCNPNKPTPPLPSSHSSRRRLSIRNVWTIHSLGSVSSSPFDIWLPLRMSNDDWDFCWTRRRISRHRDRMKKKRGRRTERGTHRSPSLVEPATDGTGICLLCTGTTSGGRREEGEEWLKSCCNVGQAPSTTTPCCSGSSKRNQDWSCRTQSCKVGSKGFTLVYVLLAKSTLPPPPPPSLCEVKKLDVVVLRTWHGLDWKWSERKNPNYVRAMSGNLADSQKSLETFVLHTCGDV